MSNKKIILGMIITVLFILLLSALYLYYVSFLNQQKSNTESDNKEVKIQCTADARQCPDGTFVGRSGPDCEFVCPQSDIEATSASE